ncbi:hypothetical protein AB6D11_06400 [Vibrio splendidus]
MDIKLIKTRATASLIILAIYWISLSIVYGLSRITLELLHPLGEVAQLHYKAIALTCLFVALEGVFDVFARHLSRFTMVNAVVLAMGTLVASVIPSTFMPEFMSQWEIALLIACPLVLFSTQAKFIQRGLAF